MNSKESHAGSIYRPYVLLPEPIAGMWATRPPLNRSTSCLGRKGQVAILENSAIWRHTNVNNTRVLYTGYSYHMIREFEGELSGVLMERICRQWAEWWQMTSSSFVSPLDCLTSFLGISLSRAVSSFGRITNVPKLVITAETYIRSWRKPPEIPEVCRMVCEHHGKAP